MSLFDTLGSTARLKIIRELSTKPRYVSELAENVGMDGKTAAHHLSALEDAGLVESYQVSRRKYYRLVKTIEMRAAPSPDRMFVLHADDAATDRPPDDAATDRPADDAATDRPADDGRETPLDAAPERDED